MAGTERKGTGMKAVRFARYGGPEVLEVADVPEPSPGPGQVLVQVKAAGINPGEAKIRDGLLHARYPATFPSGEGSDLAGIVAEHRAGRHRRRRLAMRSSASPTTGPVTPSSPWPKPGT